MTFISTETLPKCLPDDWQVRADRASAAVRGAPPSDRARVLRNNAQIWRDLKDVLAALSAGKCWYCETRETRSDSAVDHFRPKGSVAEATGHDGYWWLAFDFRNYRFSCTLCNSRRVDKTRSVVGGKQDHFPLVSERRRCYGETDTLSNEAPLLLDPTDYHDPPLIWFEPDGSAVPSCDAAQKPEEHERARASIHLFHLNHSAIRQTRRDLYNNLSRTLRETHVQYVAALDNACENNAAATAALKSGIRTVCQAVRSSTPFSSAARAMLLPYRVEYPWVESVLMPRSQKNPP